jgi:hypothetical protein
MFTDRAGDGFLAKPNRSSDDTITLVQLSEEASVRSAHLLDWIDA